jgi:hypothetical protein
MRLLEKPSTGTLILRILENTSTGTHYKRPC